MKKGEKIVEKAMKKFGKGELHMASKKGPVVTSKPQALAIALSEKKEAKKNPKKMMKKGCM